MPKHKRGKMRSAPPRRPQQIKAPSKPAKPIPPKQEERKPEVPLQTEQPQTSAAAIQLVRGMRDILPKEQNYWQWIRDEARKTSDAFSFGRIDLPVIEYTKLYERPLGPTSDVVSKEMFSFVDRSGLKVSLRPEGTAGVVRAYLEHGMQSQPQPVRLMYLCS